MRINKGLLFLISCLCFNTFSYAQLNNDFFSWKSEHEVKGSFTLQIENLNYFRNVEYKSTIDEGRTWFGYQLAPEIAYHIKDNILIKTGLWVKKDFGDNGFNEVKPLFGLKISKGNSSFLFGNLEGGMNHNLIEPVYDPERIINNRLENGMQYLLDAKRMKLDVWFDWQKMIYYGSEFREEFNAGIAGELFVLNKENFQIGSPFHILAFHKGGEIDQSGLPTLSQFTFSYGGSFKWIKESGDLEYINLNVMFNNYEDISTEAETFIDGIGQLASLEFYGKKLGCMLAYWDAHQFQSPLGDVIYQSVSRQNPLRYNQDYRKLAMLRLKYEHSFGESLSLMARTNNMIDLNQKTSEFIAELYLRWSPTYLLNPRP